MRIFYFAPENTGVGLYRFHQPLSELKKFGQFFEIDGWGFDFSGRNLGLPTIKELKRITEWGDVFLFGRLDTWDWFNIIKIIKEFSGKKILLDIDDNIYEIPPYLPANKLYEPNGQAIKIHEEIIGYVDGIIVSTPRLAELYKEYRTWIIPNCVREVFQWKPHVGVNIGYMASSSHLENAGLIEYAVFRVLKKYPHVKFYYTKAFQGFMDFVPEEIKAQINYLPFFPLKYYLRYVNNLKLDIGLAPLMYNDFNRCKSAIRVLEYWQNQMAVIASPLDEYARVIKHGFNGYLAKDDQWFNWIEDMVINEDRRRYMSKNGVMTLKKHDIGYSVKKYKKLFGELMNEPHSR